MAYRIAPKDDTRQPAKTKPVKRKSYREFIKTLPCIITKQHGVECAHVSYAAPEYGAAGRGKSQKSDDRFCLPLSPEKHREQHNFHVRYSKGPTDQISEEAFWTWNWINPHVACLVLWGLWTENPDTAEQRATELILSGRIGRI